MFRPKVYYKKIYSFLFRLAFVDLKNTLAFMEDSPHIKQLDNKRVQRCQNQSETRHKLPRTPTAYNMFRHMQPCQYCAHDKPERQQLLHTVRAEYAFMNFIYFTLEHFFFWFFSKLIFFLIQMLILGLFLFKKVNFVNIYFF